MLCSLGVRELPAHTAVLAEEETHPVDLSSLCSKLLPGFTTLGFKDERRSKGECGEYGQYGSVSHTAEWGQMAPLGGS